MKKKPRATVEGAHAPDVPKSKGARLSRRAWLKSAADRRARFVVEYLRDFSAKGAAIRAGYSPNAAHVQGYQLLAVPSVKAAVEKARAEASARLKMDAEEVERRVVAIARGSMGEHADWSESGVALKDSATLTTDQQYAVAEVSETTTKDGGSTKIKLRDPLPALQILGRMHGLPGFAPDRGAAFVRTGRTPAGVLLDGEGGVTIYLPDNGRGPALLVPEPGTNGGSPAGC